MVPVVVVVVVAVGGRNVFVGPLNDLVAQSCSNNLGRSSKVRTTFPKWPLCVTNQFQENHQKRFKSKI